LDYRLTASLVEAIGDQSVQIAELTVKLGNAKISKELAQLLLRLHRTAFEAHENAFKALFARDIALAETVRSGRQTVIDLYAEVESALRKERVDFAPQILAAASAISSIYDHSQDIADLIMPKTS
jgi:phosphate uptake regulator